MCTAIQQSYQMCTAIQQSYKLGINYSGPLPLDEFFLGDEKLFELAKGRVIRGTMVCISYNSVWYNLKIHQYL